MMISLSLAIAGATRSGQRPPSGYRFVNVLLDDDTRSDARVLRDDGSRTKIAVKVD